MKQIIGVSLIGILVAMYVIYLLQPLNNGAIALIIVLCTGISITISGVVSFFLKRK